MNEKKLELIAGIFVLTGLLFVGYLTLKIGGNMLFQHDGDTLYAEFSNVGGLKAGSKVQIAGVSVGKVEKITLDPKTYYAHVQITMNKGVTLDADTIASIKTNGLIGEKFISLLPGGSSRTLSDGDTIYDTESALDIEGLISKVAFGSINENE